jgi:hypothetical protein
MKMKFKIIIIILFIIASLSYQSLGCTNLKEEKTFSKDTILCYDEYIIEENINILKDNIIIDCNGSKIKCNNNQIHGIIIDNKKNITIKKCIIDGCQNGIYSLFSERLSISDSLLINNKIGIAELYENESNLILNNNIFENNLDDVISFKSQNDNKIEDEDKKEENEEENKEIKTIKLMENRIIIEEMIKDIIEYQFSSLKEDKRKILNELTKEIYDKIIIEKNIYHNFILKDNKTEVQLIIEGIEELENNFLIYEYIPKCAAELHIEIDFKEIEYEVINPDPLIMWKFNNLKNNQIEYIIENELTPECKKLFQTILLKTEFGKKILEEERNNQKKTNILFITIIIISLIIIIYILTLFFKEDSK